MNSKKKELIRITAFMTACLFMLYGIVRGEVGVVLSKAVNICFECIGLG